MDTYDPDKRIALVMDEWGTWYDSCTLPDGANYPPGQGTMRDAIIAATMLNMFNNHCERVRACNLAMIIGGLHPIMIIDNDRMFFTPSYHVFEMFTPHMEATMLPTVTTADRYDPAGYTFPGVNASASRDAAGKMHLTLTNIDIAKDREVLVELRGASVKGAAGRVLRGEKINSFNTVDEPDAVKPAPFDDVTLEDGWLEVQLPAMSVVLLEVQE
ncbi:MAG: alpha-N-arabinofuranosidase, partial [Phycisphaerae bacterium]|nr:alpha-N-arabinofuranosidase [Phycisphaerae bacterium]